MKSHIIPSAYSALTELGFDLDDASVYGLVEQETESRSRHNATSFSIPIVDS